jgi:hypothetical protein
MGFISKIREHFTEKKAEREYLEAKAMLESPDLFSKAQRAALYELFPKAWTHMDNFTQEEIFRIAVTMALFGMACDTPQKLKNAMDLLLVQKIYFVDGGNPNVLKRA